MACSPAWRTPLRRSSTMAATSTSTAERAGAEPATSTSPSTARRWGSAPITRSPASGHSGRSPTRTQVFLPNSSGYGRDEDWSECAFAAVSARGGVPVSRRDVNDLGMQEETAAADVDPGQQSAAGPTRRVAVVIHPAKHDDMGGFQAAVRTAMAELGWAEPLWLETRPDDTGERLAREAVRSGVDLVLASGGRWDHHRLRGRRRRLRDTAWRAAMRHGESARTQPRPAPVSG
jgi:hypothetical protein